MYRVVRMHTCICIPLRVNVRTNINVAQASEREREREKEAETEGGTKGQTNGVRDLDWFGNDRSDFRYSSSPSHSQSLA